MNLQQNLVKQKNLELTGHEIRQPNHEYDQINNPLLGFLSQVPNRHNRLFSAHFGPQDSIFHTTKLIKHT